MYSKGSTGGLLFGVSVQAALIGLAWEFAAQSSVTVRLIVSSPIAIFEYAFLQRAQLAHSLVYTAGEAIGGLVVGVGFALAFGATVLYWPRLARLAYPWLVLSQVIPLVAVAPVIILIFGTGPTGKAFLAALMSFFPVVANLIAGIESVPRPGLEFMKLANARNYQTIRHVVVPHCTRFFFAGLRVAVPFSVIGAIVAEFNGAEWGLGKDVYIAAKRLEPELMMSSLAAGSLLAGAAYLWIPLIERALGPWYFKETS